MDPRTGDIFRGEIAIREARGRGVKVVEVSEEVADAVEYGVLAMAGKTRAERRQALRVMRKQMHNPALKVPTPGSQ